MHFLVTLWLRVAAGNHLRDVRLSDRRCTSGTWNHANDRNRLQTRSVPSVSIGTQLEIRSTHLVYCETTKGTTSLQGAACSLPFVTCNEAVPLGRDGIAPDV